jgi:hypothetical protein
MINQVKQYINSARGIAYSANVVRKGLRELEKTGKTPDKVHGHLISLYCQTRGVSREAITKLIKLKSKRHRFSSVTGSIGSFSPADCRCVASKIRTDGYYVFPQKLDSEVCDELLRFALSTPAAPRTGAGADDLQAKVYNPIHPMAATYHFTEHVLAQNHEIQKLICDPVFLAISQTYLGVAPVFEAVAMWWTTAFKKEADSASAQLYHFDMDHNKWVKIFIYLTDVTGESGPHCYIKGTHRTFSKPNALLSKGYVRISDKDLAQYYPPSHFKEICGKAGTVIIGDTAAFHKGKPAIAGHRLVFELEYGDSLLGKNRDNIDITQPSADLQRSCQTWPNTFPRLNLCGEPTHAG